MAREKCKIVLINSITYVTETSKKNKRNIMPLAKNNTIYILE